MTSSIYNKLIIGEHIDESGILTIKQNESGIDLEDRIEVITSILKNVFDEN